MLHVHVRPQQSQLLQCILLIFSTITKLYKWKLIILKFSNFKLRGWNVYMGNIFFSFMTTGMISQRTEVYAIYFAPPRITNERLRISHLDSRFHSCRDIHMHTSLSSIQTQEYFQNYLLLNIQYIQITLEISATITLHFQLNPQFHAVSHTITCEIRRLDQLSTHMIPTRNVSFIYIYKHTYVSQILLCNFKLNANIWKIWNVQKFKKMLYFQTS